MQNVESTLNETTSFDVFTSFSYVFRESNGYVDHVELSQETTFGDRCKAVDII